MAVVIVKKCENTEHDRFTLFHEMGHLLMHMVDPEGKELEGKEVESLCNAFASEVLFPEMKFREFFWEGCKIYPNTLKMLQRDWGISCAAMMYKAKELGIINDNRHIGYCVRLNRNPELKEMMNHSECLPETTNRFEELVYRALGEYRLTTTKAAALLGNSVEELNKMNEFANFQGKEAEWS